MLEPLYTADEMRAAEEQYPGTEEELMEQAGRAVAETAMRSFPDETSFAAVCGKGKNGGDGRIAVEVLKAAGRSAKVVDRPHGGVVIDALFGTGFRGEPRDDAVAKIESMNQTGSRVISVDIPSGVNASTGEVPGAAVRAGITVTFHARKVGHDVAPGQFNAGHVEVVDIGLEHVPTRHVRANSDLLGWLRWRKPTDTKYTAGYVVVCGGSPGMTGAPCLSALGAFRAGAGYVALAGPRSALPVFENWVLEAVKRPLPEDEGGRVVESAAEPVLELAAKGGALAVGPGLGRSDGAKAFVRRVLAESKLPTVVDGDALFDLEPGDWPAPRILTPHSGELARLLDVESKWVDEHRLEALRRAIERFGCTVLLKGPSTLIGEANGGEIIVCEGEPALATAGTGDVLTGIIAAFLAKDVYPLYAAATAAYVHAEAGRLAPEREGLIASDLFDLVPKVLGR
jgi:ADP-dependent NAD(P)H-hydrate dehydratase / NAD(P)H-hydrate epimerase